MLFIIYIMFHQWRLFLRLKCAYFRSFWSCVDFGIIVCSWTGLAMYVYRYHESNRIARRFKETNGYAFINLQLATYMNNIFVYLLGYCCFFSTLKFLRLCRFHRRLSLFSETIRDARRELLHFSMMFSIVFMAFLSLFYLLFLGDIANCSSLLDTAGMLFEMSLMKFDAQELQRSSAFLGPVAFTLFVFIVVFVCMSMFLIIINESFARVREQAATTTNEDQQTMAYMLNRLRSCLGKQ
jgi:hypothetical protein